MSCASKFVVYLVPRNITRTNMEKFLDVIIVLAAVAIMIARSYRKTKNAPRPQIDPRGEAPAVEETPSAGGASVEPPPIPPVAWQTPAEELPPIPPVARRMAEQEAEKEKEKEQTEETRLPAKEPVNPVLGMDLRQAVIVSEILRRKY